MFLYKVSLKILKQFRTSTIVRSSVYNYPTCIRYKTNRFNITQPQTNPLKI